MLGVVSLDVSILNLNDTGDVVFINRCKDVNNGRKSASTSNMLHNGSKPKAFMYSFMKSENFSIVRRSRN